MAQAAPTSGTAQVTGNVGTAFAISNASQNPLAYTHAFGTQTPDVTGTVAVAPPVDFRLRSNAPYKVTATYNAPAATNTGDVAPADIGFAIRTVSSSGTHVMNDSPARGLSSESVATNFAKPAGNAGTNRIDSATAFGTAHLGNMAAQGAPTPTTVMTGGRISNKGTFKDPDNALSVSAEFAFLPQYFTPSTQFDYTVTFVIAAP